MARRTATPSQRSASAERAGLLLRRGMDPGLSTGSGGLLPTLDPIELVARVGVLELQARGQSRPAACLVHHHPLNLVTAEHALALRRRRRGFEEEEASRPLALGVIRASVEGDMAGRLGDDANGSAGGDAVG